MELRNDLLSPTDKWKSNIEIKEIIIPVPWGYLAAKWWGKQDCRPIVLLHGWLDNAGSFDTLIPLLPKHIGYLAIDLPGHGSSSHFPSGMLHSQLDFMYTLHLIVTYFQWDKVSLISHSFGAVVSFLYAGTFPERCDMLIAIDGLKPVITNPDIVILSHRKNIEESEKYDRRILEGGGDPPSYNYNELIEKLTGTDAAHSVTKETAPILLERGIKPLNYSDRWCFTRDIRIKNINYSVVSQEVAVELARSIVAPILYIRGGKLVFPFDEDNIQEVLNVLRDRDAYKLLQTDKCHYLHLTDPEYIQETVSQFILKYRPANGNLNSKL